MSAAILDEKAQKLLRELFRCKTDRCGKDRLVCHGCRRFDGHCEAHTEKLERVGVFMLHTGFAGLPSVLDVTTKSHCSSIAAMIVTKYLTPTYANIATRTINQAVVNARLAIKKKSKKTRAGSAKRTTASLTSVIYVNSIDASSVVRRKDAKCTWSATLKLQRRFLASMGGLRKRSVHFAPRPMVLIRIYKSWSRPNTKRINRRPRSSGRERCWKKPTHA